MGTLQAPIARDEEESHVATQAEEAKAVGLQLCSDLFFL